MFFGAGSRRFARTLYVSGRQVVGSVAEDGMKWKRKKDVFSSEKALFSSGESIVLSSMRLCGRPFGAFFSWLKCKDFDNLLCENG